MLKIKKEKEGKDMPDLNMQQAASEAKQKFEHAMDGINAEAGGLTKDATKMMLRSILRDLEKVRERLRQLRNDRVGLEQELSFADSPEKAEKVQKEINDVDQEIIDLEKQEKDLEEKAKEAEKAEKSEAPAHEEEEAKSPKDAEKKLGELDDEIEHLSQEAYDLSSRAQYTSDPESAGRMAEQAKEAEAKAAELAKRKAELETQIGKKEKAEEKAPDKKNAGHQKAPVKRRWSEKETEILRTNYGKMSKKELSELLGRSPNSIDAKAKKMPELQRIRRERTNKENAPGSRRRRRSQMQGMDMKYADEWIRRSTWESQRTQESKDAMKRAETNVERKNIMKSVKETADKISKMEAEGGDREELKDLKKKLKTELKEFKKAYSIENVLMEKANGARDTFYNDVVVPLNDKRIDIYNDINAQFEKLNDQLEMARQQGRIGLISMKEAIHKTMLGIHNAIEKLFTNLKKLSAVMERRAHGMTIASKQLEAVAENQIRSLAGQKLRDIPSETEKVSLREKYHHAKTEAFGKAADKAWQKGATMAGTIAADKAEKENAKAKLEKMQGDYKRKHIER